MKKEIIIEKIKKTSKPFFVFLFSGIIFILVAKASMNFELFFSELLSIIFVEVIFLSISFVLYNLFFKKIKNLVLSYISYYFSVGLFGLLFVEYFFNENRAFVFPVFLFLFLLKSLQVSVARLSVDVSVDFRLRETFLKQILFSYGLYISVSSFTFFALQSKLIWSFAFIVLLSSLTIFFSIFLYRVRKPKQEKPEKPLFDDVAFY